MSASVSEHKESSRGGGVSSDPQTPTPSFDIELIRSLRSLASIPRLAELFGRDVSEAPRTVAEAERCPGIQSGDFKAWPIFVTPGWRNVDAPVYNLDEMRSQFPEYYGTGRASGLYTVVAEGCRNVGQHGRKTHEGLFHGKAYFAPGGIFVRELSCGDEHGRNHRMLVCMVSDEGPGIRNPSESLLDGVGGPGGEDHRGLGVELSSSLLCLIKSARGEWFLYDGLNHDRVAYADGIGDAESHIPKDKWVKPVCQLDLDDATIGCKKIFVLAHPEADRNALHKEIVAVLSEHGVAQK